MPTYDEFFMGSVCDDEGKVTCVDVYPHHGVPREELVEYADLLIKIINNVFKDLEKTEAFNVNMCKLLEFGKNGEDHTAGRVRQRDEITDKNVLNLLGSITVPELVGKIRTCFQRVLESLEDKDNISATLHGCTLNKKTTLPEHGTGLTMVYRNLEYRLARNATFEHTDAALVAVAQARSLEKLACSDWSEQGKKRARLMASAVRVLLPPDVPESPDAA